LNILSLLEKESFSNRKFTSRGVQKNRLTEKTEKTGEKLTEKTEPR
jgi:hypothetical protein